MNPHYDNSNNITIDTSAVSAKDYTIISNAIMRNRKLSLKAIGLLVSLLSRNEKTWNFSLKGESELHDKDGIDSIRSAVKELEQEGYITREQRRDKSGKITGTIWHITDHPTPREQKTKTTTEPQQITLDEVSADTIEVGNKSKFKPASEAKMRGIIDDLMKQAADENATKRKEKKQGTRPGWGSEEEKEDFKKEAEDGFVLEEWIEEREKPAWMSEELFEAQQDAIARLRYDIRDRRAEEVNYDEY